MLANPLLNQQPQQQHAVARARSNFFQGLAHVMNNRGTPLPTQLTGVPSTYDPTTSLWKFLDLGTEAGIIRMGGKDLDLYQLWTIVLAAGGGLKARCIPSYLQSANLQSTTPGRGRQSMG